MEGNQKEAKTLIFCENFAKTKENLLFFEISEDFLSQLKNEKIFRMKDDPIKNHTLITTSNGTYKIKKKEFSNSLYLCSKNPNAKVLDIITQNQSIFAAQKVMPNKNTLYNLLKSNYLIDENTDLKKIKGVKRDEATQICALSCQEFDEFAKELNLVKIGDDYSLIDEKLQISIFHEVLLKWAENQTESSSDEIDFLSFYNDFFKNSYPLPILNSVIKRFSEYDFDDQKLKITYQKVCVFLAEEILLTKENYFFNEFSEILDKAIALYIPKNLSFHFSEDEINKIKKSSFKDFAILIDSNNYSNTLAQEQRILIQYINKHKMSFDFNERLEDLFTQRKKFFYEELVMWLLPTTLEKTKISEIILKDTRMIYEKISKNNLAFFRRIYPEYINNIIEDKNNYLTIKYFVNKL